MIGIFFVILTALVVDPITVAETHSQSTVNCDISHNPCIQSIPGCNVTLDINPKPVTAMRDLTFTVILSGKQPEASPCIDLGMPGMTMGPNRVSLKPKGKGVYEGHGVIVRCPSGHRVWSALVTVAGRGTVEFIFEVAY